MTAAIAEENDIEVVCLFCGSHTPAPAPKPARRRASGANYRVSIVRCRVCGKEAPYQFSASQDYDDGESAKAAGAGAD